MVKIPRVYLDTSVIGGCFDSEFCTHSNMLFEHLRNELLIPVTSFIVAAEIANAPELVRNKYKELLSFNIEQLNDSAEVASLLDAYCKQNILTEKYTDDMNHLALATVASVDTVMSWNFKHIVRFDKIKQFNAVNVQNGYKAIQIISPREAGNYGR
jgi:hypothetical protein